MNWMFIVVALSLYASSPASWLFAGDTADDTGVHAIEALKQAYTRNRTAIDRLEVSGKLRGILGSAKPTPMFIQNLDEDRAKAISQLYDGNWVVFRQDFEMWCALDLEHDRLRSSFRQVGDVYYQNTNRNLQRRATPVYLQHRESIVTPNDYFSVNEAATATDRHQFYEGRLPSKDGGNKAIERRVSADGRTSTHSDVFDPRRMLQLFGGDVEVVMAAVMKSAQRGDLTLVVDNPGVADAEYSLWWYLGPVMCSIDIGKVNDVPVILRSQLKEKGAATFTKTWSYESRDGVFFPTAWSESHIDSEGNVVNSTTIKIENWLLNRRVRVSYL